jgi:hypothetical protein
MAFDPKKYLIKVQGGRQYLPVSARLIWFREQHPDWGIETRAAIIDTEKQYAVFEAIVFNGDGKLMAKGTKMEDARGFPDYIEKAETGAIGRALAVCGFGTQFAPELDELASGRFVDSPQPSASDQSHDRYDNGRYGSRDNTYRPQPRQEREPSRPSAPVTNGVDNGVDPFADLPSAPAAAPPAVKDSTPVHAEPPVGKDHACAACGRELTQSQEVFSVRKYGLALCPTCQKERRATEIG